VSLFPFAESEKSTDNNGRFTLTSDSARFGGPRTMPRIVIARELTRNLAATLDLEAGITRADLKLEPAWTVTGRVVDTKGAAIPRAEVRAALKIGHLTAQFGSAARADAEGRFEIKALPRAGSFSVQVSAQGFGPVASDIDPPEGELKRVDIDHVQLLAADQRIAGVVLDADDKPVGGALISVWQKTANF
jgi:hypothetical protein